MSDSAGTLKYNEKVSQGLFATNTNGQFKRNWRKSCAEINVTPRIRLEFLTRGNRPLVYWVCQSPRKVQDECQTQSEQETRTVGRKTPIQIASNESRGVEVVKTRGGW